MIRLELASGPPGMEAAVQITARMWVRTSRRPRRLPAVSIGRVLTREKPGPAHLCVIVFAVRLTGVSTPAVRQAAGSRDEGRLWLGNRRQLVVQLPAASER